MIMSKLPGITIEAKALEQIKNGDNSVMVSYLQCGGGG